MGMEIEITTMDEMCDLMCNNRLPRKRKKKRQETKDNKGIQRAFPVENQHKK